MDQSLNQQRPLNQRLLDVEQFVNDGFERVNKQRDLLARQHRYGRNTAHAHVGLQLLMFAHYLAVSHRAALIEEAFRATLIEEVKHALGPE